MQPEATNTEDEPPDSSQSNARGTVDQRRLDRRAIIRGAGAVLLASSFAGCYHEQDDGGDDGEEEDDGGGPYSVDDHPAPGG